MRQGSRASTKQVTTVHSGTALCGPTAMSVQAGETMRYGKATVFALAMSFALAAAGCAQKCCLSDYDEVLKRHGLPDLESTPNAAQQPTLDKIARPPTVDTPEREPWYVTLNQAIAMALENGNTGLQSTRLFGTLDDDLVTFQALGGTLPFGDSIRVLALNPAITGTAIETNLSRYDAVMRSVLGFNTQDQPPGTGASLRNGEYTVAGLSIEKANAYGGLANITFGSPTNQGITPSLDFYSRFQNANAISGTINPQYTPNLSLTYQQPLLFGFGPDINAILAQHPESFIGGNQSLLINQVAGPQSGILIARIAFDQQRADFERSVNYMLANVETAYWNLYGSFVNLYSAEQALRQAHTAWKINKSKYEVGKIVITQYAQIVGQYQQFRGDRIAALGQVLEAERTLRGLLGLPMEDGKRLVPVDTPTVAPYVPDWDTAYQECMNLRPELIMQRSDLRQKQLELIRAKNSILPDLEFVTNYNIHGVGDSLDGDAVFGGTNLAKNALRSLASDHFNDGAIGLTLAMPLGFRAQNAALRASQLRLAQSYLQLRDQEYRAVRYLRKTYSQVFEKYEVIIARRAQREAFAEQVEARQKEFEAGTTTADFLLEAQRQWANALSVEYQSVVDYNNALVAFQFAKGTLLHHNSISIAEGALPECVQVRATENEEKRAHAIVARERANVAAHPVCAPGDPVPALPSYGSPSLPGLFEGSPKMPANIPVNIDELLPPGSAMPKTGAATSPGMLPNATSAAPAPSKVETPHPLTTVQPVPAVPTSAPPSTEPVRQLPPTLPPAMDVVAPPPPSIDGLAPAMPGSKTGS